MNVPYKNKTSLTMPGISATRITIPLKNIASLASYWDPQTPLGGESPNLWTKSRSGLELVDSMGGTNPKILPSCFSKYYTGDYAAISDNGALDIGNTYDFTLYAVVRNENATAAAAYCVGKCVAGALDGRYGINSNTSTGYWSAIVNSSGGSSTINSTIDSRTSGFVHLRIEITQATKKFRFYINNNLIGTEQTLTGTFGTLANEIKFRIGSGQNPTTPWAAYAIARTSHSDTFILRRLMTTQEKTDALLGIFPTDCAAHWPCNTFELYDTSGNGFHLTAESNMFDGANILWGTGGGSRQCLDKGYSLYRHPYGADLQVPYLDSGVSITTPSVPSGYYFVKNVPGSLTGHNKANSMILFDGANWDRSNVTIYSANARVAYAPDQTRTTFEAGDGNIRDYYLASIPKAFHVRELQVLRHKFYLNSAYWMFAACKFGLDSLDEIVSYDTVKTGSDLKKLIDYTLNTDSYHDITYEFQAVHWCATRGNKVLAFDSSTKVLSLSLDGGANFTKSIDLTGIITIVVRAHIYANGNISFAGHTKMYYSTDNLTSYHEATTLGIDGNPFVPSTYNNFRPWQENDYTTIGGTEVDSWGTYTIVENTQRLNVNVWLSIDSGLTVKSIYKANTTLVGGTAYPARHIHNATVVNGKIIVTTGDGTDEVNIFEGTLSLPAGTVTWVRIAGDNAGGSDTSDKNNSPFKISGIVKYGDNLFWQNDCHTVTIHRHGIWKAPYAEYPDLSKAERVVRRLSTVAGEGAGFIGNLDGILISPRNGLYQIDISTDEGKTFFTHTLIGGPTLPADWGGLYTVCPKNTAGEYRCEIIEEAEVIATNFQNYTAGTVLLLKIVKPS